MNLTSTDLNDVVLAAAWAEAASADAKGVILSVGTPSQPLTVCIDAEALQAAVSGLVAGAIAAASAGDIILLTTEDIRSAVVVAIADPGPSVPERYQLPPQGVIARAVEIATEIVASHGGQLTHDEESGLTVFKLTVPLTRGAGLQ